MYVYTSHPRGSLLWVLPVLFLSDAVQVLSLVAPRSRAYVLNTYSRIPLA